ncbi:IclR family transcriptional regulator [Roseiarcaceae bacterium H3SJ34-1]|uniref:IclR family transcriptional regulator n=1 Tax=Terripilifer ovatus TaxID=3032367 RepID=UPI003AB9AF97|nr:IclR family transcriptional regulator [Roseiarcaceae bacterium H3SJ34-1]
MRDDPNRERYNVEAVQRVASICALFSAERPSLSLREIARLTAIPVRTAAKIVSTLEARKLLSSTGRNGEWSLGPHWLQIADYKRNRTNIREAATSILYALREQLNETFIFGVRDGDRRIIAECLISTQPIRRVSKVGDEIPLHVGSSGRSILSGLSDAEISEYLSRAKLINYGYDTMTDPKRIWADIRKSRQDGYLTSKAEITKESFSSSAAIRSYRGEVVAALTITFPLSRLTDDLRSQSIRLAMDGAQRISRRLGYAPASNPSA